MRYSVGLIFFLFLSVYSPGLPVRLNKFEQINPHTYAAGFADRYGSANCGWVTVKSRSFLIDVPHGVDAIEFLSQLEMTSGKTARDLVVTHLQIGDAETISSLVAHGIERIETSASLAQALLKLSPNLPAKMIHGYSQKAEIGEADEPIELIPFDQVQRDGAAAVYFGRQKVLFTGPIGVNGPRMKLPGSNTEAWLGVLAELQKLPAEKVVPGFGTWDGPGILDRQRRFLTELRRQVGYLLADGATLEDIEKNVSLPPTYYVWMPYDTPLKEDIAHVYEELTVPQAPYNGNPPQISDPQPHALVLIGDQPHEPGHLEEGLRPVFEATGVIPHFAVDVRALSAENLAKVRLLVILRDGLQRYAGENKQGQTWMTREQESAVVQFVEGGGGFLNLHNSMGLYPADGPYLKLVGGRYTSHGPLERFRVEVLDPHHYITRGVTDFTIADEQHWPEYDETKVHLLLQSRSDQGRVAAAGWVYEPGRGRLCHLASGHTRDALNNPMFQRLMQNAVKWCLKEDGRGDKPGK